MGDKKQKGTAVVFITDDNYALPTLVAVTSIVENKREDSVLDVYIVSDGMSAENEALFAFFERPYVHVHMLYPPKAERAVRNDGALLSELPANGSALLKFDLTELLPQLDKVLYLDGDVIVQEDLGGLFSTDLKENYCAAVKDVGIGIPTELAPLKGAYFNSGVMLLNLKKMREDGVREKLYRYRAEGFNRFMDQDAFCMVFRGRVLFLPVRYNLLYTLYKFIPFETVSSQYEVSVSDKRTLLDDAVIIHLCSREKPWRTRVPLFSDLFLRYYRKSPLGAKPLSLAEDLPDAERGGTLLPDLPELSERRAEGSDAAPLVSVVIPVFNAEAYLDACIRSVLGQSLGALEVIFVDNGSTDGSVKKIGEYKKRDGRVKLIRCRRRGAGNARNMGMERASAPYILFLDADDLLCPGALETFAKIRGQLEADMYVFDFYNFDDGAAFGKRISAFPVSEKERRTAAGITCAFFPWYKAQNRLLRGPVAPWNKIYARAWLASLGAAFDDLACTEDRSFYFHTALNCNRIAAAEMPLVWHRKNNTTSLTGDFRSENFECNFRAHDLIMQKLRDKSDDVKAVLCELTVNDVLTAYALARGEYKRALFPKIVRFFSEMGIEHYEKQLKDSYWYCRLRYFMTFAGLERAGKSIVPVVFSVDDNYAPYLGVAIRSLIDHASEDREYLVFVFHTKLSEGNVRRLERLSEGSVRVVCQNVSPFVRTAHLYSASHYSVAMYYRLLAAELLPFFEKVVYLDCDLVLLADIAELCDTDLQGKPIAAARNPLQYYNMKYVQYTLRVSTDRYFNSGVLVIDTARFLREKIKDKCFALLAEHKNLRCPDQDALNMACRGRVCYLPPEWNFQWHFLMETKPEYRLHEDDEAILSAAEKDCRILHFTSGNKPWIKPMFPLSYRFWQVARRTEFYEEIVYKNTLDKMLWLFRKKEAENGAAQGAPPQTVHGAFPQTAQVRSLSARFFDEWRERGFLSAMRKARRKLFGERDVRRKERKDSEKGGRAKDGQRVRRQE